MTDYTKDIKDLGYKVYKVKGDKRLQHVTNTLIKYGYNIHNVLQRGKYYYIVYNIPTLIF